MQNANISALMHSSAFDWLLGMTTLRGEYIFGTQPGTSKAQYQPANRVIPDARN